MDIGYTWIYIDRETFLFNLASKYGPHLLGSSFIQRWEGDGVKVDGGIFILASFKHHFIRVHENLEQHPSNNKSIVITTIPRIIMSMASVAITSVASKSVRLFKTC